MRHQASRAQNSPLGMPASAISRRGLLQAGGSGLGSLALSWLISRDLQAALAVPHHPPKARSVIWLFMEGGPSHLDLLDPKPLLN